MNKVAIDLVQRHVILSNVIDKAIVLMSEGKHEQASFLLHRTKQEINSTHLPLYPKAMLTPPTNFFSRLGYIIRWWKVLWSDLTFQLQISNQRLEKL